MVFGFLKRSRTTSGPVSGFGKIPGLGDFLRTPGPSDEAMALEQWLVEAMETGEARDGAAFKEAFTRSTPHGFLWNGGAGLVAGVFVPSHDAVSRRFPVVVCAPLPNATLAPYPQLAPFVLHEFFHHAADAAARAARTRTQAEFNAQVATATAPSLDGVAGRASSWEEWSRTSRAADVFATLFDGDAPRATSWALTMIVESTTHYRGKDAPPLTLGLRAPLGRDVRTASALWIDLVRHAAGWSAHVPSYFFPLASPRANALVQLGATAPATVVADLVSEDTSQSESVCDLTPADDATLPVYVPDAVTRAMSNQAATVADVLDALGR